MCLHVTSHRSKDALTLSYLEPNKIIKTALSINPGLADLCKGLYNIYHVIQSSRSLPYYYLSSYSF